MPKMLIIADDLTGAADCGVTCVGHAREAIVMLDKPDEPVDPAPWADAAVVAIDADTRCMTAEQAGKTVALLMQRYASECDGRPALLFKKIDSTLRGHWAVELKVALDSRRASALPSERVVILFAPAFPAHHRTTVSGLQLVHGKLLESTALGESEEPRPRSNIAEVLRNAALSCGLIELASVRADTRALKNEMIRLQPVVDVLVCDAETNADLRAIANAGTALGQRTVWAGSAGLARHIPLASGFARDADRDAGLDQRSHHGPQYADGATLYVVGSPASASREQALALAASGHVATLTIPHSALLGSDLSPQRREYAERIAHTLENGGDLLLQLDSGNSCKGMEGRLLTRSLARMIQPCREHVSALVVTGGETARAILDTWGIRRLNLIGEVEPGLPYSVAEHCGRELTILTKAGGFGTPGTLLHCREFLQTLRRDPIDMTTTHDNAMNND